MTILLTGFEANDGGWNASERLVSSLSSDPPREATWFEESVRCEIMPGDTHGLEAALRAALARHRPRYCVFVGQAPGRNRITLERVATNWREFRTPDRAGNTPRGESIVPDGPAAYASTLPDLPGLVSVLQREDIPAAISHHAGTHLCNQLLYLGMHIASSCEPVPAVGFVHIPILPHQVIHGHAESPCFSLEMSRRALLVLLAALL
jgi:pyroglutamyl-peptidase